MMDKVNRQSNFNPQMSSSAEMPGSGGAGTSTNNPSNMEMKMLGNVEGIPDAGSCMLLYDTPFLQREPNPCVTQMTDGSPSYQPGYLDEAGISSSSQPQVEDSGKISKKDARKRKSILELLPEGTPLLYLRQGKVVLKGSIQRGLVLCQCCNTTISPSKFEKHAGYPYRKSPFTSIHTCNGKSLRKLSECARFSTEHDICSICHGGGDDLLPCGKCSQFYHIGCVDRSSALQGELDCKSCRGKNVKRKELDGANADVAIRGHSSNLPREKRALMAQTSDGTCIDDLCACAICKTYSFTKSGFGDLTVLICDQCERQYHVRCLRKENIADLKGVPEDDWFCCKQCNKIHLALQKLVRDDRQRFPESVSGILEKKLMGQGSHPSPKLDIKWRLVRGKTAATKERVWLSAALKIFHDEFETISISRGTDLIPSMVYGRSIQHYDFYGMYCAVLMVNSVVVSIGLIRIFGEEVAELPLVATKRDYQGKGYFRLLYFCIEDLLSTLSVKDLILPAAKDAESMWRNKFGFEKVDEELFDRYNGLYHPMMFEGTSVLHKLIPKF